MESKTPSNGSKTSDATAATDVTVEKVSNGAENEQIPKSKRGAKRPRQGIRRSTRSATDGEKQAASIKELCETLLAQKNVVFVTGAGLSVASGIAPFRGASDAVWSQSVHEWGTREKFEESPLDWYNMFWLHHFDEGKAKFYKPNSGHEALAGICKTFPNTTKVITQNIDRLHSHSTGTISPSQLIEIHGFHGEFKCFTEDCPYSTTKLLKTKLKVKRNKEHCKVASEKDIPHCPSCDALMCPNCLLFDEEYDDHDSYQFEMAQEWLKTADAIVFIGTSFAVHVTNLAFEFARDRIPPAVAYNINVIDNFPVIKAGRIEYRIIIGKSEEILPELAASVTKV